MAAATTRADFKGNKWIINGQKVWTTSAHKADWALLLARTDWDAPKHKGLSYFLLNMRQPGVNAQPLKQMNGHASFNQVFITDAEIEPELQMGKNGEGWKIATTTLMHERRGAGALRTWAVASTRKGRIYEEENAEIATTMEPYKWYPQRAGRVDLLLERAKATGKINDPVVRQELAKVLVLSKAAEWTAMRARAAQEIGRPQGPEGSLGKLLGSHVARAAARVHTMIDGANAMLTGSDGTLDGVIAEILVSVPATSIAGGTDEIQRNIISERILQHAEGTRRIRRQAVPRRAAEYGVEGRARSAPRHRPRSAHRHLWREESPHSNKPGKGPRARTTRIQSLPRAAVPQGENPPPPRGMKKRIVMCRGAGHSATSPRRSKKCVKPSSFPMPARASRNPAAADSTSRRP